MNPEFVLITGCDGFIGFHLSRHFLDAGISVIGVDRVDAALDPLKDYRHRILSRYDQFYFSPVDVCCLDSVRKVVADKKCTAIFALAAETGVRSEIDAKRYWQTNLEGSKVLAQVAIEKKIPKLIFASTSSVYSGNPVPFSESMPTENPASEYAASKIAAEKFLRGVQKSGDIEIVILRLFTVYGPVGRPDMAYFRFIHAIDRGLPVLVYGDGNHSRDFTYIGDVISAFQLASRRQDSGLYNIGSGQTPVTVLGLIRAIENELGKPAQLEFLPPHPADMLETQADCSRAQLELGWSPATQFQAGLKACVKWYFENRDLVRLVLEKPQVTT